MSHGLQYAKNFPKQFLASRTERRYYIVLLQVVCIIKLFPRESTQFGFATHTQKEGRPLIHIDGVNAIFPRNVHSRSIYGYNLQVCQKSVKFGVKILIPHEKKESVNLFLV